ncbi:hypothetical protein Cgig2_022809 [Carnegiea gigantea]|uniref:Uncharacterized protein n=1 Tax=Carnegiea gigantea TaxID=171969 RepID=A0A9Q1KNU9_9CARY|nr:hypothetical protein Cgig2_022809 [Carnegiea gigantea]
MGFISRKLSSACGTMCICCPAMRSRSRQPVKRYKKLVAEIFPKSPEGQPSERKLVKLCEYAGKNPIRIPKITKLLEERFYKELRNGHLNMVRVVVDTYSKLLCMCDKQMAYFAASLLTLINELLGCSRQVSLQIAGCQTLTRFIYSQTDGTYAHNIEKFVLKVCSVAREAKEDHQKRPLRAACLQCLSAMVWYMGNFSHFFEDIDTAIQQAKPAWQTLMFGSVEAQVEFSFSQIWLGSHALLPKLKPGKFRLGSARWFLASENSELVCCPLGGERFHIVVLSSVCQIVYVTLDNYEGGVHNEEERAEQCHHWVDEVIRCEGRGAADASTCSVAVRVPPERKNISSLTREEIENPRIWAQICLQRMAELGKESTTMRQVLEPMLVYFDTRHHWSPPEGLAMKFLCDMAYFVEVPEYQMRILNGVIRHMDHKNVAHDPIAKSCVVQVAASLARQIRSGASLADVGCVSDLLRHLRKSLQSTASPIGETEGNLNIHLQNSIESCLLEVAKGINNSRPLFDLMVIALEKLPPVGIVARATLGSVLILAYVLVAVYSQLQQAFPEALLVQLLKAILHPDTEARNVAHQIFAILLFPSSCRTYETRRWKSSSSTTFASVTALLEKLRKDKDSIRAGDHGDTGLDDCRGREYLDGECKQAWTRKSSPNLHKLSSIIDGTAGASNFPEESCVMKLSEDQIAQLLSGFWIQANLSDNLPSNFEAIAHSYCLTLISSHIKNTNHSLVVRFFQLPLSLRNVSLCANYGMLPPAGQRSLFITSTAMLLFAAKMYHMHELNDLLKSQVSLNFDPYLGVDENFQVYVKPQAGVKQYGSASDNQAATLYMSELQDKNIIESDKVLVETIARYLCCIVKVEEEELLNQLSAAFSPDDAFIFAPKALRELDHTQILGHLKELSSLDGELSISSVVEDDVTSSFSAMNICGQKVPSSPSGAHIMSIGQLLESALEVAGQVVGTSVLTSPLSYSTMAGHCEALETGTRKKLSNWLAHETTSAGHAFPLLADGRALISKVPCHINPVQEGAAPQDQYSALRLPPASPFDNFLRAVSGPTPMFAGVSA